MGNQISKELEKINRLNILEAINRFEKRNEEINQHINEGKDGGFLDDETLNKLLGFISDNELAIIALRQFNI